MSDKRLDPVTRDPYAAFPRRYRDPGSAYATARGSWARISSHRKRYRRELFEALWPYPTVILMGLISAAIDGNTDHEDKAVWIGMTMIAASYMAYHTLFILYWCLKPALKARRVMKEETTAFTRDFGFDPARHPPVEDIKAWKQRMGLR